LSGKLGPIFWGLRVTITFFLALLPCCTRTKFQQPMVHGRQFCASLRVINKLKIEDTVRNSLRVSEMQERDKVVSRWDRMSSINRINQFFTTNTLKRERGQSFLNIFYSVLSRWFYDVNCLLWIDKTRAKDKMYIWVGVIGGEEKKNPKQTRLRERGEKLSKYILQCFVTMILWCELFIMNRYNET